jgi:hypothetical protein
MTPTKHGAALPRELELWHEDTPFLVRFDYERGEPQWFDARAGVGSPGYGPSVCINEVNFGAGWEAPEAYPQINIDACEQTIMEKLADIEADQQAARDEAEYSAWKERA